MLREAFPQRNLRERFFLFLKNLCVLCVKKICENLCSPWVKRTSRVSRKRQVSGAWSHVASPTNKNSVAWRLRERFCVSVRRIDSSLFHCAASASGSECVVPAAQFGRSPCPQAPLALLASHGVTEVKHLRCF